MPARRRARAVRERKGRNYAGFLERLGAAIVDAIIIVVAFAILAFIPVVNLFAWLAFPAYYTYFEGKDGATPGKQLLKLKVVGANGSSPVGYGTAFVRWIGRAVLAWLMLLSMVAAGINVIPFAWLSPLLLSLSFVAGILGLIGLVGFLWIIVDEKKQSWYDKLANTFVVRE